MITYLTPNNLINSFKIVLYCHLKQNKRRYQQQKQEKKTAEPRIKIRYNSIIILI